MADIPKVAVSENALKALLDKAIKAVPAVRYALGVVGVAAAAALCYGFFKSPVAAIVGVLALLVLMILLVVFAALASIARAKLAPLAFVLAWAFVVLFSLSGALTCSSIFFDWPKAFPALVGTFVAKSAPTEQTPHEKPIAKGQDIVLKSRIATIDSLPEIMRTAVAKGLSDGALSDALAGHGSLTLDGATLVLGPPGQKSALTLAVSKLMLTNGARIVTNGNDLNLQAADVNVIDGGIYSFAPEDLNPHDAATGVAGAQGLDGGNVQLELAKPVSGPLVIDLAGQNGQRGGQGGQGASGAPGSRGQNGVDGLFDCRSGGGDGGRGLPGAQGNPGLQGGNGGNGGVLVVNEQLYKTSNIRFSASAGHAGAGGAGGSGGRGGAGGEGGSGSVHCGGGHGGPPGPDGPPGSAGAQGGDGQQGKVRFS